MANLVQMAVPFPIEEGERVLGLAPFFHSMGLCCVLNHALANGGTVVALARFDLEVMLRAMETHGVQQALVAPPLLAALAHHPLVSSFDLSALRTVGSGGAPAGAALEQAVAERLDCLVGQGYGITEASPLVAVCPLADPSLLRPGSVGLLVGGTEARVVDPRSGATLPAGEDGELWVRGPQLMAGYRDDPEATAATIDADGWLHTGDLGHIDEDGSIFLVDRLKELIKVRGFQVAPAELEAVLVTHPAVADAAVIGVPDERDGERPKAFVVSRGPLDREELSAYVAERVAPYKRLGAIEEIDELPKSLTGKLLRRVLVERERQAVRERAPMQTTTMARTKRAGRTYAPWGMLAAIDLHGGDRTRLADPDSIRRFVPAVIAAIGMRAHGPLMIDRFGDDELEGWSALQFIETSSITIHADEVFGPLLHRRVLLPAVRPGRRRRDRRRALRRDAHRDGARAMIELAPVLGVLAGGVGIADTIPDARDTLRGATRAPHVPRRCAGTGRAPWSSCCPLATRETASRSLRISLSARRPR